MGSFTGKFKETEIFGPPFLQRVFVAIARPSAEILNIMCRKLNL
jgi:hypothetical protein